MSAAPPRPPQVLIVEDDPGNALVMKTILVRLGRMAVVVSEDGDQVLAWIAAGHVDAVVMDVSLSNTRVGGQCADGLELTRRIRRSDPHKHLPVVALTSLSSSEDESAGHAAGVTAYLVKLDDAALVAAVRQHGGVTA